MAQVYLLRNLFRKRFRILFHTSTGSAHTMAKKSTILDIAQLAGVSPATVSRVINRRPDVDKQTRERVLRIIAEKGYVPSITAAGLAGGRNRLIGMLLPLFTWPILADLVRGISEILKQTSYELVLYTFDDEERKGDH